MARPRPLPRFLGLSRLLLLVCVALWVKVSSLEVFVRPPTWRKEAQRQPSVSVGASQRVNAYGAMNDEALDLYFQGFAMEAEMVLRRGIMAAKTDLGEAHPRRLSMMSNLAGIVMTQKRTDEAESMYKELLEVYEDSRDTEWKADAAESYHKLAQVLLGEDRFDEAEEYIEKARQMRSEIYGELSEQTLDSLNDLGSCLAGQGRLQEAEDLIRGAVAKCKSKFGDTHPSTQRAEENLQLVLELKEAGD